MQFNIIFKTIFEYNHKKFCFVHTNTFCKYRKQLRASPRVHLVLLAHVRVVHGITRKSNCCYLANMAYDVAMCLYSLWALFEH